jgi:hypothetical protein
MQGVLSYTAFRQRAHLAGALYIVAILCMLSMAGLASTEQTIARQWLEQGINSLGQIAFALGSYLLYARYRAATDAPSSRQQAAI